MKLPNVSISAKGMMLIAGFNLLMVGSLLYLSYLVTSQSTLANSEVRALYALEVTLSHNSVGNNTQLKAIATRLKNLERHILTGDEKFKTVILLMMAVSVVFGSLFYLLLRKMFIIPIFSLRKGIEGIDKDSVLGREIEILADDEIGNTAKALNNMLHRFKGIIEHVTDVSSRLAQGANETSKITELTNQEIRQQQAETEEVATAIKEMSSKVQEVALNTSSAAEIAVQANKESASGQKVVTQTIEAINLLAAEVTRASEVIQRLADESNNIGSVLDVIKGISEQTNLLALNAAIEAARAGEQGRGFAVVADEVRTLAQRTNESTQEIQGMIERLQSGASEAVQVMGQGRSRAEAGVAQALQAGESLDSITDAVSKITSLNAQIASAAEGQTAVAKSINTNVANISSLSNKTAEGAHRTANSNEDLAKMAVQLQTLVKQFKIYHKT